MASDTTDIHGTYGVMLNEGTYYLEYLPPAAAGLNARAFTTTQIMTDTILDVDFCLCSGVWVSETVDNAGDVGRYTSLALAPTQPYTPHISYHDVTSDNLKHASLSGTTWSSETVDSGGQWTSLALAPTWPCTPCISYQDYWGWALRLACRDGITWTVKGIAGLRAGQDGTSLALEPTYPHIPHVSFYIPRGTIRTLYHTYLSGTTWMSGTWVLEQVEPTLSQAGTWSSLALNPQTLHISHYDSANDDLKCTCWVSGPVDSAGDVGWYTSLALDSGGNPHISYFDETNDVLKYAWLSGTTWISETVDSAGGRWWGWGTSLALDGANAPYISYYKAIDAINGDLRLARFDGKVWIIQTVYNQGDVGPFGSLALDPGGCPHISYYYYDHDATNGDLRYACIPAAVVVADFAARRQRDSPR